MASNFRIFPLHNTHRSENSEGYDSQRYHHSSYSAGYIAGYNAAMRKECILEKERYGDGYRDNRDTEMGRSSFERRMLSEDLK